MEGKKEAAEEVERGRKKESEGLIPAPSSVSAFPPEIAEHADAISPWRLDLILRLLLKIHYLWLLLIHHHLISLFILHEFLLILDH